MSSSNGDRSLSLRLSLLLEHAKSPRQLWRNILLRRRRDVSGNNHVFVIGPPRSGTTLIKALICAHNGFVGLKYETTGLLGYRNIITLDVQEIEPAVLAALQRNASSLVDIYDGVADWVRHEYGCDTCRFVDKVISIDWMSMYLWTRRFPRAQYVGIIRDPRDAYVSARKIEQFPHADNPAMFAGYWTRKVTQMARISSRRDVCLIRYEDLVSSPSSTLESVMTFLGSRFDDASIEKFRDTTDLHEREEKHKNLGRPLFDTSVGTWKQELNTLDADKISKICLTQMRHFGYSE